MEFSSGKSYFKEVAPGRTANPNPMVIYYYALMGMAALFGGFWGVKEITDIQADLSPQGARFNMAPVHKLKAFGSSFTAAIAVQFAAMLLLLAYLTLVLKIDFGGQLPFVLLTCLIGSITGVTYGAMISAVGKNENIKMAILIGSSMAFSFLAGLMAPDIRYTVTHAVPFLQYLNPAYLISDAFYSLYYYTTYTKFFLSIGLLAGYSVLFYLVVYFITRRQKYASL
jgi:ABC-2 type transport system permease protein